MAAMAEPTRKTSDVAERARQTAFVLYQGKLTPHRSCGIALAETFGLPSAAYQALRRGGITGEGECGAYKAGELVIGQILGDPDPTGAVTPQLRAAMQHYQAAARTELVLGAQDTTRRSEAAARSLPLANVGWNIQCNALTAPHGDFMGEDRRTFCTVLASDVARLVAAALESVGHTPNVTDTPR